MLEVSLLFSLLPCSVFGSKLVLEEQLVLSIAVGLGLELFLLLPRSKMRDPPEIVVILLGQVLVGILLLLISPLLLLIGVVLIHSLLIASHQYSLSIVQTSFLHLAV